MFGYWLAASCYVPDAIMTTTGGGLTLLDLFLALMYLGTYVFAYVMIHTNIKTRSNSPITTTEEVFSACIALPLIGRLYQA